MGSECVVGGGRVDIGWVVGDGRLGSRWVVDGWWVGLVGG